jgi:hypothetical protein
MTINALNNNSLLNINPNLPAQVNIQLEANLLDNRAPILDDILEDLGSSINQEELASLIENNELFVIQEKINIDGGIQTKNIYYTADPNQGGQLVLEESQISLANGQESITMDLYGRDGLKVNSLSIEETENGEMLLRHRVFNSGNEASSTRTELGVAAPQPPVDINPPAPSPAPKLETGLEIVAPKDLPRGVSNLGTTFKTSGGFYITTDVNAQGEGHRTQIYNEKGEILSDIWGDPHVTENKKWDPTTSNSNNNHNSNFHFGDNSYFILPDGTEILFNTKEISEGVYVTKGLQIKDGSQLGTVGLDIDDSTGMKTEIKEIDNKNFESFRHLGEDGDGAGIFAWSDQANNGEGGWAIFIDNAFYDVKDEHWDTYLNGGQSFRNQATGQAINSGLFRDIVKDILGIENRDDEKALEAFRDTMERARRQDEISKLQGDLNELNTRLNAATQANDGTASDIQREIDEVQNKINQLMI